MTLPLRVGSLIARPDGEIDYGRVRSLASVILALSAGLVACLVMAGTMTPDTDVFLIGVSAMVAPLTGGKIMDAVAAMRARRGVVESEPVEPVEPAESPSVGPSDEPPT